MMSKLTGRFVNFKRNPARTELKTQLDLQL